MKFSRFPLLEIILSTIGIFVSVAAFVLIQVAGKVENASTGPSPLAILELVVFVLMVAALTARKPIFTKIVSIIALANLLLSIFITAIVCSVEFQSYKVSWDTISFLTISVVALIALVLYFIYFLIGKSGTLRTLARVMDLFSIAFLVVFAILLIVSAFAGNYSKTPLYAIEMALLLINSCIFLVTQLLLQKTIVQDEVSI